MCRQNKTINRRITIGSALGGVCALLNSIISTFDEKSRLTVRELYPKEIAKDKLILTSMLEEQGIRLEEGIEFSIGVFDGEELVGTGSIKKDIIVCLGVKGVYRSTGLINNIINRLIERMHDWGVFEIKVFTKLIYKQSFLNIGFSEVSMVNNYALMEFPPGGLKRYRDNLRFYKNAKVKKGGVNGSVVMNCNPFTLGHRFLIEEAKKRCDHLYVFVVEEDSSAFRFTDRFNMVKLGTSDLKDITVIPSGKYMISRFTFPGYFIGTENKNELHADFDIDIFTRVISEELDIKKRFVGTEPNCINTRTYNNQLSKKLPEFGIELVEITRCGLEDGCISASKVRGSLLEGTKKYQDMVHKSTLEYLESIDIDDIRSRIVNGNGRH